jgi:hypothetical protein
MFTPGPAAPPDGALEGRSVVTNTNHVVENNRKPRYNDVADTHTNIIHVPDTIIPLLVIRTARSLFYNAVNRQMRRETWIIPQPLPCLIPPLRSPHFPPLRRPHFPYASPSLRKPHFFLTSKPEIALLLKPEAALLLTTRAGSHITTQASSVLLACLLAV